MRKILLSLLLWSLWSAAYARPDFLVDADWLAEHIDDENLVVLEVRYHPHRYYTVGHIPGAVQVQRFKDLGDNPDLLVEWTDVYDNVVSHRKPNVVLLDARPKDMYTGEVIRHSIQGGHIPGAVNIVSLDGTDAQSQKWLSDDGLAELYKDFPKNKTVYIYCHDGFRMSLAYLQLKHLGVKDVRLYNGGWSHWGNELTLPVVEGDKPYSGDYEL